MKLQSNLQLRKIGSKYMVVSTMAGNVNMSDVFTLNETAACIWQYMEGKDLSAHEVAACLCEEYEVEPEEALRDVERLWEEWKRFGLITE